MKCLSSPITHHAVEYGSESSSGHHWQIDRQGNIFKLNFGHGKYRWKSFAMQPGNVIKARKEGHYVTPDIEAIAGSRRELEIYRRKLVNQIDASNEMIVKITAGKIMSRSRLREFEESLM